MSYHRSDQVSHPQKPSFWLLHWLGWLCYILIFTLDNTFLVGSYNQMGAKVWLPLFFVGAIAAILTIPLRYLYQRCWRLSSLKLFVIIVLASLLIALLWTPIKNIILWKMVENYDVFAAYDSNDNDFSVLMLFMTVSYSFFIILAWSGLYFSINFYFRLTTEKEQHLAAQRLSHNAQIRMLRYQINPHFLFNTLNAISTLVLKGNKEKANGMLARLSTFLRYSLDNDPEKKIPLYQELKALMLYLEIEKTRFDDRLSVNFKVEAEAETLLVPSLILQPLVENCIKYAISNMVKDGRIDIVAKRVNNLLHMEVADNGPKASIGEDSKVNVSKLTRAGVGLRNICERLEVLYPERHHFDIYHNSPQGFRVVIEIPVEEN